MKLVTQSPKKALKAFLKQKPLRSQIDLFKGNLIALLDKISIIEKQPKDESEEHLKNNLRDFLRDTYYRETNAINTKDKKDLVIHLTKTTESKVAVIIEAKRPTNIGEMITADNPNKKALHELILYYLNERNQAENNQLKQLVATNIYEWFIIDANYFDKHIYRNTQIKKLYETKLNDKKDNPWFYEEVTKIISKIDVEIPCIFFDIREFETYLRNTKKEDDKELIALFKILSPEHLLKIATPNDSNSLDEKFYKELLYIIGLEEAKEGGKNIIRRKKEKRNAASLIELAIEALKTEDTFHRVPDIKIYGENKEEQIFNISLELCITWINRILFLKLLEGQLITYHQGNKEFGFLDYETIHDFDELFKLFHKVLAVNISERTEAIKAKYNRVPYLNSSLFEISDLEDQTVKINTLENDGKLELISTTVLKDIKKKVDKLPPLEYLFRFLDAYDFASEGTEDIQEDNKTLINASVLGKVFEKINGYKDGSIFTPAFITMYMCRQSIRLAVVEKFNEVLAEKGKRLFDKFDDIKNYTSRLFKTEEVLKANEIINSIRICDPAVGSGHFLVSALNEIIAIKSELGILADEKGNNISGYEIEIVNDELIITDLKGNFVEYKLNNGKPISKEVQRLHKTLFHEKEKLIESCLFGVDINPKSVLICRLRLWIELLKNAYYKEPDYIELETLPNIDINIKCGNSLISRFSLDSDLSKALKSIKYDIKAYRGFVNDYKNEKSRDVKRGLQKIIDSIKTDFRTEISNNDPKKIRLKKLSNELYLLLSVQNSPIQADVIKGGIKKEKERKAKLETEIDKLSKEIEEIKNNTIYKNAFEWRFEFPEVLDNNGDFAGFDVIIANPPYIGIEDISWDYRRFYESIYKSAIGRFDLYALFIEKALSLKVEKGGLAFIIPGKFLNNKQFATSRKLLCNNQDITVVKIDDKVFDKAQVNSVIVESHFPLIPNKQSYTALQLTDAEFVLLSEVELETILKDKEAIFRIEINNESDNLIAKIEKDTFRVKAIADVKDGIVAGSIKDLLFLDRKIDSDSKKLYFGKHLTRYKLSDTNTWVNYKPEEMMKAEVKRKGDKRPGLWMRDEKIFKREKILSRFVAKEIIATYDNANRYYEHTLHSTYIKDKQFKVKYVLGLFNSGLLKYYYKKTNSQGGDIFPQVRISSIENLPVKLADETIQNKVVELVDKILEMKEQEKDSTSCERKIDELVYKLYDISPEEQKIIEEYITK